MVEKRKKRATAGQEGPDWFLADWMRTMDVSQADIARETGWNASTVHGIYHGRTEYYRAIVNRLATVLRVEPFELLMHPDEAMAIRRMRGAALQIAADQRTPFRAQEPD